MDLYGQEPEAGLLAAFVPRLRHRSLIDVGSERGAFAEEMLRAGIDAVHAIEPEPANITYLREQFENEERVTIHAHAAGEADGKLELHRSIDGDGSPVTFGHTVLERPNAADIGWREAIGVRTRSLASLVESGEIPARVGILKIDTEGHDFAIVAGLGRLECDVVMVEHWQDLPRSLGPCPWSAEDMISALQSRGFTHFAFIAHLGEFVILQWDDSRVPVGHMGNLIFLHDDVLDALLPCVLASASSMAQSAVVTAAAHAEAAVERLAVIEHLTSDNDVRMKTAAKERHATIEALTLERDVQARAADERLTAVNELRREYDATTKKLVGERDAQAKAARERLAAMRDLSRKHAETVAELTRERDLQAEAAEERLATIEELTGERDAHSKSALDELRQERDLQAQAAEDRLATIEELQRERDLHAKAAKERLETVAKLERSHAATVKELTQERDLQAQAAEERLAAADELRREHAALTKKLVRERDAQAKAAQDRLAAMQKLAREHAAAFKELREERDRQAHAAEERLAAIEELTRERDLHAYAAEQRLAAMEGLGSERNREGERPSNGWR